MTETYAIELESGARLSFQRFVAASELILSEPPRSLGALPVAKTSAGLAVPLEPNEGLWVACETAAGSTVTSLRIDGAWKGSASTQLARSAFATAHSSARLVSIAGFMLPDRHFQPIVRRRSSATLEGLRATIASRFCAGADIEETLHIAIVTPERFERETGYRLPPLDPSAGYQGHRLP